MQLVNNAGLVLAAPYLPLLWQRLGWLVLIWAASVLALGLALGKVRGAVTFKKPL